MPGAIPALTTSMTKEEAKHASQAIFFRRRHQPSKPPAAKLDVFSVSLEVRLYAGR
jgi:hypothetical protein